MRRARYEWDMYETGTSHSVRAFHRMPGMPPPEGERHSHDYRFDVVVSRIDLDDRGMVVDLDLLTGALSDVAGMIEEADLDQVVSPSPDDEGVTVEVLAKWVHERLVAALGLLPGASLSVRVWESPVAFGGYTAALAAPVSSA
jgi:6-pyruvoyltetrahydropterin/6-carboxytetrahydropterin synthase